MPGGLSGFTGCYENQSTPLKPGPNHYLSQIIWPDRSLTHTAIEAIKVSALDDRTLQVTAYAKKHAVLNQTFTVGEDFQFEAGQIVLPSRTTVSTAREPGNPLIGTVQTRVRLGVEETGRGYTRETTTVVGTAYLFIPVAGQVSETIRFNTARPLCAE